MAFVVDGLGCKAEREAACELVSEGDRAGLLILSEIIRR